MSRSFSKKARASAKEQGYRSSLEVTLQKFFLANGITFKYETAKIQWEDKRFRKYTPDFILPNGVIIEAKGLFTSEDRRKHKEVKEQHPELEIRFVFENSKRKISKVSKTTYADWCDKLKIKHATKEMPIEWAQETGKWTNLFFEKEYDNATTE